MLSDGLFWLHPPNQSLHLNMSASTYLKNSREHYSSKMRKRKIEKRFQSKEIARIP